MSNLFSIICFLFFSYSVIAGPSIGQFELKDLDIEVGAIEFQSQNAHSFNQPDRKFINDNGEFEFDDNEYIKQRHALEIELGLTNIIRSRLGIEFEKERFDDPASFTLANSYNSLKLSEAAFETVLVLHPPSQHQPGLGFLAELEIPVQGDNQSKSIVFGPIVQYDIGSLQSLINLYGIYHFSGEDDGKWDLSYATHLLYQYTEHWNIAIEAYGTIDRLGNSGYSDEARLLFGDHNQHRLGPVIYYNYTDWNPKTMSSNAQNSDDNQQAGKLNIGVGWLFGLNDNTPEHTIKWSIEYEF